MGNMPHAIRNAQRPQTRSGIVPPPPDSRLLPLGSADPRAAFTAAELLVVLVIMALVAVLILPSVDSFLPVYNLKDAARRIATLEETARAQAIVTGQPWGILYEMDISCVSILKRPKPDTPLSAIIVSEGDRWEKLTSQYLPKGVRLYCVNFGNIEYCRGLVVITIPPTGLYSRHAVIVSDAKERTFSVITNPLIGTSQFYEGTRRLPEK